MKRSSENIASKDAMPRISTVAKQLIHKAAYSCRKMLKHFPACGEMRKEYKLP